jgi:t-SNARE complex subunit (syntaxin)
LDAITEQQQEATQKELDEIMDKIQDLTKQIKTDLSDMESETKIIRSRTPKHQDLFIRDSQYSVLLKSFSEIIQEYKMVQEEHQARLRERLTKHALIVNPEASPEEVGQLIFCYI